MSLAVPWVISAAAEQWPDAFVEVAGEAIGCASLDRITRELARSVCSTSYSGVLSIPPGMSDAPADVLLAIAVLRIGVPLSDQATEEPLLPPADADVLESTVWSETAAAVVDGAIYDHSAVIAGGYGERELPTLLDPIVSVLAAIVALR